jgi:N-acetyl-gamma-glutamylphosphate reductase
MIKVGVVGAIGYAGREFVRLIVGHPQAQLVCAVEMESGKKLQEVLPNLRKMVDLELETFDPDTIAKKLMWYFLLCLRVSLCH